MERLEAAEASAAEWAAEKEQLQKAFKTKDELLQGEVSKNATFANYLEKVWAEVEKLKEEAEEGAAQNATLSANLVKALADMEELETDKQQLHRANMDLVTEANRAKAALRDALEVKEIELELALATQKAELEEKYVVDFEATVAEEVRTVTNKYKGQLQ